MKKIIMFGVVALGLGLGLVGCNSTQEEEAPAQTSAPVEQTVESKPQVDHKQAVLSILQKGCAKIGTVHYDESQEAYIITPTDSAFIEDLGYVLESGDTTSWNELVDSFAELSGKISETVGSGTSIAMANPANTSNVILIITDGVVVYDAVSESMNQ